MKKQEIPVFLITGFLESGKTTFLSQTIGEDYFKISGNTLLLLCEEGVEEYDPKLLSKSRTKLEVIDSLEELAPQRMEALRRKYLAERVIIEYNGVWDPRDLTLPDGWFLHQQLMLVDGSTFDTYYMNMKSVFGNNARNSEVIMVNRCNRDMDLARIKRIFRGVNQQAEIIFEDDEGELDAFIEEDLPYDLNAEVIDLSAQNYGIWFLDAAENPDRYDGKKVRFTAMIHKEPGLPPDAFVPGRMAMNCCEADMIFLGYLCRSTEAPKWREGTWASLTVYIRKEFVEAYGEDGPVMYAINIEPAQPIKEPVSFV